MLCHTLGFQAYRWPHSTGQGESDDSSAVAGWFRHRVHVVNCPCSLFWAWTFDRGVITGSSSDIARIISRVNWRYNQHKIKWLVERLQLSNCCNSKICTRTWRIIHGGEVHITDYLQQLLKTLHVLNWSSKNNNHWGKRFSFIPFAVA